MKRQDFLTCCMNGGLHGTEKFLLLSFLLLQVSCTVATPEVKKLFSSLNNFSLKGDSLSITDKASLNAVTINAFCGPFNTGFEYKLPGSSTWDPVPTSADSLFTLVDNKCNSSGYLALVLDLYNTEPFKSMTLNSSFDIFIRDQNDLGLQVEQKFTLTYSQFAMAERRFSWGQGFNQTVTSTTNGAYTLKGSLVMAPHLAGVQDAPSGSYKLKGRVIIE